MTQPHNDKDKERAERWRLSTGQDLEHALRAAERLLAQAEERRRHEQNRRVAIISIIAGTILSLFASLVAVVEVATFSTTFARAAATAVPAMAATAVLAVSFRALRKQQRESELDYHLYLATRLASMVGEVLLDVAEREGWSYLRIEATKLRLSAFP